jgi:2-polyprenyl-3-methyl-5-hydroxy-6-metoxy-1,4-benzoquinol methylase
LELHQLTARRDEKFTVFEARLPESGFDLVHSRWTLLHTPQRELVLETLVAALRPGGTLFLESVALCAVLALRSAIREGVTRA